MKYKYPVYVPSLRGNEKKYLNECIDTNWLTETGRFVGDFENSFKEYVGAKYATVVNNGTLALHLALMGLEIGPEDEVIVPSLTYIASANAITYTGAKPVFVDCEPESWQIDPIDVENKITTKTKAIMPVHLYGHSAEMEKLKEIANKHNLFIIEDCAEAFGTYYNNKHVGTLGDIGTFSFFGNKTITSGEGGMLVTNNKKLFDKANHLKGQGQAISRQYWHDVVGYNYRMTNLSAAVGLAQLENAKSILKDKSNIAKWYRENLKDLPLTFQKLMPNIVHSNWMITVLTENSIVRDELRKRLDENKIETRPTFFPVHTMPMYSTSNQTLKNSEDIGLRGMSLPSYPDLKETDVKNICAAVKAYFEK